MPCHLPRLSRSWAWPVAGLVVLAAGCGTPRDPQARTAAALAELERLQPKLAKAGTPDAEVLAEHLAAVRTGLAALPPPGQPTLSPPVELPPIAAARCPDDGCTRLTIQAEVAAWRLNLRGGGEVIKDVGPLAAGLAVGWERAAPIDSILDWSWGIEVAGMWQDRQGPQHVALFGIRPVVRGSLALGDHAALTLRPIIEVGQASIELGQAPSGVLDRADVYFGIGARAGFRYRLGGGDLAAEVGWRHILFNASASQTDYRVTIESPEASLGWMWSF